jgi:hypothetical protein
MKTLLKTLIILVISSLTISCSKDDDNPTPAPTPIAISDVFVAGYENTSPYPGFFYKNNTKTMLPIVANESSQIEDLLVDGNDVYISGNVNVYPATGNSYTQACYWKNNVKVNLPHFVPATGGNWASGFAITIVNGDIYILGIAQESFGVSSSISVWKNGSQNYYASVPFGSSSSIFARSICVYNNDIYVAGAISDGTTNRATYWKNGVATTISSALSACSDIKVDQNGIHIAYAEYTGGGISTAVKYWKDGVNTTISTQQPQIGKMLVNGTDVYITGAERETGSSIFKACYWKNGTKTELTSGNTLSGSSIKMGANGDLFIKAINADGNYSREYWQNNIKKTLGTNNDNFRLFDINNKK